MRALVSISSNPSKLGAPGERIRDALVHIAQRGLVHLRGKIARPRQRLRSGQGDDVFGGNTGDQGGNTKQEGERFHGRES